MLYEVATLDIKIGVAAEVAKGVLTWISEAGGKGRLLGTFATDIGPLNQVIVLRAFETAADVGVERQRALHSASPFNAGSALAGLSIETFAPFPFLPPIKTGAYGGVYEFRTYAFKTGGLPPMMQTWEAALPARIAVTPLLVAMYALDGTPRFTHIWPYADAGARAKTRADVVARGIWPPKGGPDWLATMRSTLATPLPGSPLH